MKYLGRIGATLAGVFVLWLAVSFALRPEIVRPSTTEQRLSQDERVEVQRTWYGEAARWSAIGLMGFFGVTLVVAPWRRPRSTAEDNSA